MQKQHLESRAPQGASAIGAFCMALGGASVGVPWSDALFFAGPPMKCKVKPFDESGLPPLPLPAQLWMSIVGRLGFCQREKQVVELILRHQKQKEIAHRLGITPSTVQSYLQRIYLRLRVSDEEALVLRIFAESHGLGPSPA